MMPRQTKIGIALTTVCVVGFAAFIIFWANPEMKKCDENQRQSKRNAITDATRIAALDSKAWSSELIGKQADDYFPALGIIQHSVGGFPFGRIGEFVVERSGLLWLITTDAPGHTIVTMDGPWKKVE